MKKGSNIAVISSRTQQSMIMKQNGIDNPDPRKQFIDNLNNHILKWNVSHDDHLIIMLDDNEYQGEEKQGLEEIKT